jgi:amino acid transporter
LETPGAQPTVAKGGVEQSEELVRAISAPLLFFYVLGDVLGSGIYALIGVMAANVGGAFWTSFVVGVGAAMLTGFAYAELITKYPHAAGAAMYAVGLSTAASLPSWWRSARWPRAWPRRVLWRWRSAGTFWSSWCPSLACRCS